MVDASVVAEILIRSPTGERIRELLEGSTLTAPDLLDAEVHSVLRSLVLARRLTESRALEALEDLLGWGIRRLPNASLMLEAWSFRTNVSGYDALYLAAARSQDATLITVDRRLGRAPVAGVRIHNVVR